MKPSLPSHVIVDTNSRACLHQDFANASLLYESAWKHDGDRVAVYTGLGRIALAQGHIRLASKCAKPVSFRLLVLAQRFERHCPLLRFHSSCMIQALCASGRCFRVERGASGIAQHGLAIPGSWYVLCVALITLCHVVMPCRPLSLPLLQNTLKLRWRH